MAALTTGQEVKHAASCSAELITETDSLSAITLWATQWGREGDSVCMKL